MIKHYPIEWWATRLETPLSLARFGDGEFLCIEGKKGGNSHGCAYTPELRADLMAALAYDAPGYLKGMQRILPAQSKRIRSSIMGEWVDTEIFGDALAEGKLGPLFDTLRTRDLVIVSSKEKRAVPLSYRHFIEVPRTNAHAEKERIVNQVLDYCKGAENPPIVLFACGMAAGTFVHALHGKVGQASLIDIGHIFDPFVGEASRDYLAKVPEDVLMQNL